MGLNEWERSYKTEYEEAIPNQTVTGNIATKKQKIPKTITNSTLLCIYNQSA